MGKKNFKTLIQENQRLNNIKIKMVHLSNQTVENNDDKKSKTKNNKNIKKMKNNKQTVFMAIAKGREIAEPTEIKRYIGVASCKIIAINPNKAMIDQIYGRPSEKEPNYLGESEINGVKVPQARIDIYYKLSTDKNGHPLYKDNEGKPLETVFRKSFFMTKTPMANRDNTKFKVVDKYGNTAWVTKEELENHIVPTYSNGPASISKDYRPLYHNEEIIMNIVKTFLRIPTIRVNNEVPMEYDWNTKQWVKAAQPENGEVRFDAPEKFFEGNFTEIQAVPSYQPKNCVKILLGVRSVDGKMYQDIYDVVVANTVNNYANLEKSLNDAKANGRYADTEFRICEFQEYSVTPTNFNGAQASVNDPFANADDIF